MRSLDFIVEATEPTNSDFGKFSVIDESGDYVTIMFYPLDNSLDSQEFGDKDKEMIMLLSYHSGELSISIDTNGHSTLPEYSTFDSVNKSVAASGISDLIQFYEEEMNGVVPEEYYGGGDMITEETVLLKVKLTVADQFDKSSESEVTISGKNVTVKATGADNISVELIRTGMLTSIYNVLKDVRDLQISVDFIISFPVIDSKGNETISPVMRASFSSNTISEMNWDKFLYMDIPEAADSYWAHSALEQ